MTIETLRIGMLGSGFMARLHLQALQSVRHCRLSALYSPTSEHREALAQEADRLGLGPCRAMGSVEELLRSGEVDAVWVVGPNDTRVEHLQAIRDAVVAGEAPLAGVAVEKPLGRTLGEARTVAALAEEAGLHHGYLENQVFAPAVTRGKAACWRQVAAGAGRPYLARASEEHRGPHSPWFWQAERQGGGVLLDMACHSIEVARFLLTAPGAPRDSLVAHTATGSAVSLKWSQPRYAAWLQEAVDASLDYRRHPVEDVAFGSLELADEDGRQLLVQATTSWAYVGPGLRIAIEMLGPEYSMSIDTLSTNLKVFVGDGVGGSPWHEELVEKQNAERGLLAVVEDEATTYGYVAENRHMVEAFRHHRSPLETLHDGVATIEWLMALYLSSERQTSVALPDGHLESYVPAVARREASEGEHR